MILTSQELKHRLQLKDYPCAITADGTDAIVVVPNHKFTTGEYVNVTNTVNFNGLHPIEKIDSNTIKFSTTLTGTENGLISINSFLIETIVDAANNYVKEMCGVDFGNAEEASEKYTLKSQYVFLKRGYVDDENIVSIKLSKEANYSDPTKYIEVPSSDYLVNSSFLEIRSPKLNEYLRYKHGIQITYTTKPCPAILKTATMALAEYYFANFEARSSNLVQRSEDSKSWVFEKTIPKNIQVVFDQFTRPSGIGF